MQNMNSNLEAEIAALSQQLEEKKRMLNSQESVHDKELVRQVLEKEVYQPAQNSATTDDSTAPAAPAPNKKSISKKGSNYLDSLDRESAARINMLISLVPEKGFKAAIEEAKQEEPFILDAFHDALVTKLYDELKQRGLAQ